MKYEDLTPEEYAERLYYACDGSYTGAITACDLFINDLKLSLSVCMDKDNGIHPHAQGIIAGCLSTWTEVRLILQNTSF